MDSDTREHRFLWIHHQHPHPVQNSPKTLRGRFISVVTTDVIFGDLLTLKLMYLHNFDCQPHLLLESFY